MHSFFGWTERGVHDIGPTSSRNFNERSDGDCNMMNGMGWMKRLEFENLCRHQAGSAV
jgi:hypothetical protein